ncbi:hypothetical protein D6851_03430 [Altericroceibacterium spongiae]|uniref:Phytoene synthase n=1 Tax=Altericroceibacterium spongiae TaxID=2320269 RepID=A0A420ES25_9SPHN|nr:squalene/phytoene synthase family protein [Altericroceibacterium spongiae]RKF23524.1 hypothetical protein D6851_03430 [Altericroceibacterium spongiae]
MADNLIESLALPQRLALTYAPAAARAPTLAVLALDTRLSQLVSQKREVMLAQMRLAWWRDMFGKPADQWPKGDAVLGALKDWPERNGLVDLVDGWEYLLKEELDEEALNGFAEGRAAIFGALAVQLGEERAQASAQQAARLWSLGDLAANVSEPQEKARIVAHAQKLDKIPEKLPRRLRTLAVLAGLARRGLSQGGTALLQGPASGFTALRIGLTGR